MNRVAFSFAAVQMLFVATWTVYVVFLPQLAAQAGIDRRWIIYILMADQAIFAVSDMVVGIAADRVARRFGALARWMLGLTVVSCAAFLLLPFVAPAGSPALLIGVATVWAVTSSALRAPPLTMMGKYVKPPLVPRMAALMLLGLGLANGFGPYLTAALRNTDPRLPFIVASLGLVAAVATVLWAEQHLARADPPPPVTPQPLSSGVLLFFGAVALLALGFQLHFALNTQPLYLRFAQPADLEKLTPVFWVGFGVLMVPAQWAAKRHGAVAVMAAGGLGGALAAGLAPAATSLNALIAWQFFAGGAWGAVLMSATAAAVAIGHTGREGAATGGLCALLAFATLARMGVVAGQWNRDPGFASLLVWLPAALWAAAGIALAALAARTDVGAGRSPATRANPGR
jgi:Major Facilitator Superfamily